MMTPSTSFGAPSPFLAEVYSTLGFSYERFADPTDAYPIKLVLSSWRQSPPHPQVQFQPPLILGELCV